MATMAAVEQERIVSDGKVEIEELVANPTWRSILYDIVASENFDPWNIDIVEITNNYLERIRKMKILDLHIPSNVILAAAILVRLKSEALRFETEEQYVEEETFIEEDRISQIPMLRMRIRIPPKRSITLTDLIRTLEEVMEIEKKREERRVQLPKVIELNIPRYDVEKEMEKIYEISKRIADSEGWLTFSNLATERFGKLDGRAMVMTLIPLLHLWQDEKVHLLQEEMFGEIFIKVEHNGKKGGKVGKHGGHREEKRGKVAG